ncbi:MAG TPA: glutathione S-transferase [Burkholderiaceae bacterium]|nr:glutathione S-transferase [Burkholderiaceae bacterium]
MLQVLGRPNSINVRKVLWLCAEIGLPHQHTPWGVPELPLRSPEFLALNPNGLVPVMRDGEFVLWESNTICRYLAATHERFDLLPAEPRARARVEQWMDWMATELNSAWRYAFMALVRRHADYTDTRAVDASIVNWNRHMAMLDAQLQRTGAYAAGATFTLADITLGLATHRWFMTPLQRPSLPAIEAYYERLSERPGFRAHGRNGVP